MPLNNHSLYNKDPNPRNKMLLLTKTFNKILPPFLLKYSATFLLLIYPFPPPIKCYKSHYF